MSYSFEATFRTKETARRAVMKDGGLPEVIRAVLLGAINALPYDTDDRFIVVKAQGHQCGDGPGGGSYERTSAELLVEPRCFSLARP